MEIKQERLTEKEGIFTIKKSPNGENVQSEKERKETIDRARK